MKLPKAQQKELDLIGIEIRKAIEVQEKASLMMRMAAEAYQKELDLLSLKYRKAITMNKLENSRLFAMNAVIKMANQKLPITIKTSKQKIVINSTDLLELLEVKEPLEMPKQGHLKDLVQALYEYCIKIRRVKNKTKLTLDEAAFIHGFLYDKGNETEIDVDTKKGYHSSIMRLLK